MMPSMVTNIGVTSVLNSLADNMLLEDTGDSMMRFKYTDTSTVLAIRLVYTLLEIQTTPTRAVKVMLMDTRLLWVSPSENTL